MRRWIPVFLALALVGMSRAGPKVFVFYPSLARPLAIQEVLAKKCPGLDITVFGRLADLQAMVERDRPRCILAPNAVLRQFPAYRPGPQGTRNGSATEDYVLLSIDKPLEMSAISSASIGVVGLLDRKEMNGFVAGLVAGTPRLNRVTKVEDLLPLLIFRSVSAVLVSEANMRELRKKSRANLVEMKLDKAKVGLVAMGLRGEDGEGEGEIVPALRSLDRGTLALLGVDAWK